ncbi:MAG: class I SAM-dependent methyltransferase [Proteobacteria bacterium]|nr:class I SAM-dependent methyltransferase [Pseudomonadota bacterium]
MPHDLDAPFRDYRPYDPATLRVERLNSSAPNSAELANMDAACARILEGYTLRGYLAAKRGIAAVAADIERRIARTGLKIAGRVLEFGAGTCKLSAVLSRSPDVASIDCMDFSEVLLREIAPRVISWLDGDLSKFRFLVGDMNRIDDVPDRYDWIVCFGAVHHLTVPEHFFVRLRERLAPGGRVLCMDEPAYPEIALPFPAIRRYRANVHSARVVGENEHAYRMSEYRRLVGPGFEFHDLPTEPGERRARIFSTGTFQANFMLAPSEPAKLGSPHGIG